MKGKTLFAFLAMLVGVLALIAAGCGGGDGDGGGGTQAEDGGGGSAANLEELPAASCQELEYEGEGEAQAIIVSDLPMQGGSRTQTLQITEAIRHVLEQRNWKAGDVNIAYQV